MIFRFYGGPKSGKDLDIPTNEDGNPPEFWNVAPNPEPLTILTPKNAYICNKKISIHRYKLIQVWRGDKFIEYVYHYDD
ncbi:hypothetical protein V2A85_23640 [Yersinia sp. 1252 StPb PI]|uniref:hypothetical protein n=1 Tax=Yersinia sp. 1252 StPb PI TaxID=3117404 RepID=UPI003B289128